MKEKVSSLAAVPQGSPMWTELHLKVVKKLLLYFLQARLVGGFLDMGLVPLGGAFCDVDMDFILILNGLQAQVIRGRDKFVAADLGPSQQQMVRSASINYMDRFTILIGLTVNSILVEPR